MTFEGVPECLMDRLVNFLAAERRKLREDNIGRLQAFEGSSAAEQGTSSHGSLGVLADFQRKVTPHERAILMADVLEEVEDVGAGREPVHSICLGVPSQHNCLLCPGSTCCL